MPRRTSRQSVALRRVVAEVAKLRMTENEFQRFLIDTRRHLWGNAAVRAAVDQAVPRDWKQEVSTNTT